MIKENSSANGLDYIFYFDIIFNVLLTILSYQRQEQVNTGIVVVILFLILTF